MKKNVHFGLDTYIVIDSKHRIFADVVIESVQRSIVNINKIFYEIENKLIIKKMKPFLFLPFFLFAANLSAQNFYDQTIIQKIEIVFSQTNWDYQMDTAKAGTENYILADTVKINGVPFDSVGVRYKGNSSYDANYIKNPLHIELDHYKKQNYLGVKDIKLGNNYADPSMIREVLAYDVLKNYMHCPQSNFAKVFINGAYVGLYSNTESIDKNFYAKHYYSNANTNIKCNPIVNPSTNAKCNLKYFTTGDSSNYFNFYDLKSDYGWNALRALADTVTNYPAKASNNLDMDRVIWMLAFNNVVVNLDSYSGAFCQNYYLYKDDAKHFNPTVWDLNMSFGGFPYLGFSNSSLAQQSISGLQNLSPTIHATDAYWPLINIINNNAQYKRMYLAHIRTITNELFASNTYTAKAQQFQALIDTDVQNDNNKFYSYADFQNGLTTNVSIGSYSVPGISNLMNARVAYLQSNTDFNYSTPTITAISASTSSPAINSTVIITANVVNTSTVYVGYRSSNHLKFTKVLMYDDGLHNDGSASDNVYGAGIPIVSAETEYYIYAENTNAGLFSPQRAEHEFYTLQTNMQQPNVGDVVINEFLAVNNFGQTDENGKHEDWIELYNTTNNTLNLSGLYLSDDVTNPTKYTFPNNIIIQPHGLLTIWADEGNENLSTLHCNFKLLDSGEKIILSKGATVLDSISFGFQGADISMARCPDGIGAFAASSITTYNALNCTTALSEQDLQNKVIVYPNPANDFVMLKNATNLPSTYLLYNALGALIETGEIKESVTIHTSLLSNGIYFLKIDNYSKKIIMQH